MTINKRQRKKHNKLIRATNDAIYVVIVDTYRDDRFFYTYRNPENAARKMAWIKSQADLACGGCIAPPITEVLHFDDHSGVDRNDGLAEFFTEQIKSRIERPTHDPFEWDIGEEPF